MQIHLASSLPRAHAAGVLGVDLLRFGGKTVCATAGDDGAVCAFLVHTDGNHGGALLCHCEHVARMQLSPAAVCGVRLVPAHAHQDGRTQFEIVSVAHDLRLRRNGCVLQHTVHQQRRFACDVGHIVIGHALAQRTVDVADCAQLLVTVNSANQVVAAVCGHGLQMLPVP